MNKIELNQQELARYQQQLRLAEVGVEGQLKLKAARVLCVGAGGLASPLLFYLAAAGVGTLGLVDDDQVELSNLQRQILYRTNDLGMKKVDRAHDQLLALNPNLVIHNYSQRFSLESAEKLIAEYDLVADCSDNFATRYLVNDICYHLKKPFASASIDRFSGQSAFFSNRGGPCYRCLFPQPPKPELIPNCEEGGVLGVLPGLLGTIQATEILKWILNVGLLLEGRFLTVDVLTMRFNEFRFVKNPDCELCANNKSVHELQTLATCCVIPSILPEELRLLMKASYLNCLLVDVRTFEEHQEANLGGLLIPLDELKDRLNEIDRRQEIIIYCRSGKRSLAAAQLLLELGYPSVKFLKGGILAYEENELSLC